ncbi:hypothetical protein [Paraburkholderia elongata]|uniref:Uncharacterized protein n=1 Tax=Paraburkholderia elongata TaxID=2675747 RepID=A0A972NNW2_9BURK|nr:hypothetical protein [Paraburkholderia elongata]NPT56958.1 hypothetical protein [Paraburkholderia elongata]
MSVPFAVQEVEYQMLTDDREVGDQGRQSIEMAIVAYLFKNSGNGMTVLKYVIQVPLKTLPAAFSLFYAG